MGRGRLRLLLKVFIASAIPLSHGAFAQAPSSQAIQNAIEQQRQILQQQEARRQEQLRQLREQPAAPGGKVERPEAQADQSKVCIKIREIAFEGAELLDEGMKAQIRQPFVNNDPPAKPEVFQLLPPQRGLFAIEEKEKTLIRRKLSAIFPTSRPYFVVLPE